MLEKNQDIKKLVKDAGLRLWHIADKLNISDVNFSRALRKEFSEAKKEQILAIINELKGAE